MPNLVQLIKQAATEAVEAQNPTNVVYGNVIGTEPIQIQIDQKLILTEEFIVLTKNVKDYEVETDIEFEGDGNVVIDELEQNLLKKLFMSNAKIKIKNALKVGDKVIMIRMQGGQKYVVIDKLEV